MNDWTPRLNRAADLSHLPLTPQERFVLEHVDGTRSVAQIATGLGVSPARLHLLLSPLVARGVLQPPAPERRETLPELLLAPEASGAEEAPAEEAPAEEVSEAVAGNWRQLFETRLHPLPEDERALRARTAEDPELSAFCFDPVPAVIRSVLENTRTGLAHARLVARHHRNAVGLEALCTRASFTSDMGVRRWLVRNPQLPASLFRRLWAARRLMEQYQVSMDRDVPESTRRTARELMRSRFNSATAEERVEVIFKTEGRVLASLVGLGVDGKTAALLCGRTYRSTLFIQNIARWSAAPPALIAHLLKQETVRRQPNLRMLLQRHPNAPSDARRGGA